MSSMTDLVFNTLFSKPRVTAEELENTALIPLLHPEQGVVVTSLEELTAFIRSQIRLRPNWAMIEAGQGLRAGDSNCVVSTAQGRELPMPQDLAVGNVITIHAFGGPVVIQTFPTYVIAGCDGALELADGETVYLLHARAGHLEII